MCVCVLACVRACVRACMRVRVYVTGFGKTHHLHTKIINNYEEKRN